MTFLRRLFSSDFRRAVAAEAAGEYAEAARYYALSGERARVAAMHLLRAERAKDVGDEIAALRDALRWADADPDTRVSAQRRLGTALLARGRAEGIATEKDREQLGEAARALEDAGDFRAAGEAWELTGAEDDAVRAYGKGGLVDKMEEVLARDEKRSRSARREKGAFEEYELHLAGGDRESARSALALAVAAAGEKGEYRRLLDDLDLRRLTGGVVSLRPRSGSTTTVLAAAPRLTLGRDPASDIPLRSGGVSRAHAELRLHEGRFYLRDTDSRHGTLIGGMPVIGEVPLEDTGRFTLGPDCELDWRREPDLLVLEVLRGLDRGLAVLYGPKPLPLGEGHVSFEGGRPYLTATLPLRLHGARTTGRIQLIRRDLVAIGDLEWEVL
jgi:tetratricopeptide (TPR) repeat protein